MLKTVLIIVVLFFALTHQGESATAPAAAPSQTQAQACRVGGPSALNPLNDNRTACGVNAPNPLVR